MKNLYRAIISSTQHLEAQVKPTEIRSLQYEAWRMLSGGSCEVVECCNYQAWFINLLIVAK